MPYPPKGVPAGHDWYPPLPPAPDDDEAWTEEDMDEVRARAEANGTHLDEEM